MKEVAYSRVKSLLDIDYSTINGDLIWKRTTSNRVRTGAVAGSLSPKLYIRIGIDGDTYEAHRIVWLLHYGYMPEGGIDHVDRISWHNHPDNLRETTQQCNLRNTGNPKTNTSGVKGVSWREDTGKWTAYIHLHNKMKRLGCYSSFADAVCARLMAEQCLDWSRCDDNSPANQYVKENIL